MGDHPHCEIRTSSIIEIWDAIAGCWCWVLGAGCWVLEGKVNQGREGAVAFF